MAMDPDQSGLSSAPTAPSSTRITSFATGEKKSICSGLTG